MNKLRNTVFAILSTAALAGVAYAQNNDNYTPSAGAGKPNLPITAEKPAGTFSGEPVMNGYRLSQFGNFVQDWHFVTVRFRRDTGEMRLTYANDKAWKVLQDGKGVYPDGATFIKIGIMAEEDPAFTSSIMPSGAKRYQVMVKDSKKHKETDGWGYALFDVDGKTFDVDPDGQATACHACHRIVEDRGFVFSQVMNLDVHKPALLSIVQGVQSTAIPASRLEFKTEETKNLSRKIVEALPFGTTQVRALQGELRGALFQGTIDEIRPTLAEEAARAGMPAILYDGDGIRFSIAYIDPKEPSCTPPDGGFGNYFRAPHTTSPPGNKAYPVSELVFCQSPPKFK